MLSYHFNSKSSLIKYLLVYRIHFTSEHLIILMEFNLQSAIILLVAVCYSVTGFDLIAPCVFKTTDNDYTCSLLLEGINLFGVELVITTEDHIEGRFNVDVTGFKVYSSELRSFPEEVYELFPNLQNINFQRNDLRRVGGRIFANRTNLMSLNLHRNRLNQVGSFSFAGLSSLTSLDLSVNELATIPPTLTRDLVNLQRLSLSNNNLMILDGNLLSTNNQLRWIDFSFNRLEFIGRNVFNNLRLLENLTFRENRCINDDFNNINGDLSLVIPCFSQCFGDGPASC